eukprot:3892896-Amphidinium_carterae.1
MDPPGGSDDRSRSRRHDGDLQDDRDTKPKKKSALQRRLAVATNLRTGQKASRWARKWRAAMVTILPSSMDSAVPLTDSDVQVLSLALWKDVVRWLSTTSQGDRALRLFKSDHQTPKTFGWEGKDGAAAAARGLPPDAPPSEWAFVPVTDVLLIVGQGLVGITAEGIFSLNPAGRKRRSYMDCFKKPKA